MSIIVAIDSPDQAQALSLIDQLDPSQCMIKVGKELFTRFGPAMVNHIHQLGFKVFLDLKFHDIPNTTAQAVLAAADLGVWMVNVHASGGRQMMQTCINRLVAGNYDTLLIGVTVLTSMQDVDLKEIGIVETSADHAMRLASLAKDSGLHGVVCSAQEAQMMKASFGQDFLLVTPGIRPAGSDLNDQKRVMTPLEAKLAGSDHLVIGRPITGAVNPAKALADIVASL